MEDNPLLLPDNKVVINLGNSNNPHHNSKFELPSQFIETISEIVKTKFSSSTSPEIGELWKITINPELTKNVADGTYSISEGALEIRNVKNGQFVGKAKLEKVDLDKYLKKDTSQVLSKVSSSIVSVAGQIQMAEISKKLDAIQETVNNISNFLWREKITELRGLNDTINDAIESLPSAHAYNRINDSIKDLIKLSHFFEESIEEILLKDIKRSFGADIIESFKILNFKNKTKNEYNQKYISDINTLIHSTTFLLDLYIQSLLLIGSCYQVISETKHANKYYDLAQSKQKEYNLKISNKLRYLFNILNLDQIDISNINSILSEKRLPLGFIDNLNNLETQFDRFHQTQLKLQNQISNTSIEYTINPNTLLEE
ncbi:hypothetical protein [Metasolibacillus sp. FSL K6-0083]|uniref:hypothetical protein n=1 Tax=Metasolibacillus sp. FSL K6-0083 TaxID=2921416 RepID=UPI00315AAEE8